jgi:hypothetical protein
VLRGRLAFGLRQGGTATVALALAVPAAVAPSGEGREALFIAQVPKKLQLPFPLRELGGLRLGRVEAEAVGAVDGGHVLYLIDRAARSSQA